MKKRKIKPIIISLLVSMVAFGQIPLSAQNTKDLYMPMEYRAAYKNETRSMDGKPGKNYFQNVTDYDIHAEFFPDARLLTGNEVISYTNNSPDELMGLFFHLHQNLYKTGMINQFEIPQQDLHDGVLIKSMKINGIEIDTATLQYASTLFMVRLPGPILPSTEAIIEIEWELTTPASPGFRIGTYDTTNFFIGYWYPKLCVYDDISGWNNQAGFGGYAEFYNEYGDFDVDITVPADYTVWSSGLLQNTDEIFTAEFAERLKLASTSDEVVRIIDKGDREKNKITKPAEKHTWKFRAENLPDFAFALSNKYLWDATSIEIGDGRVLVNAVYNENAINFKKVAEIGRNSVRLFSTKTFSIPFPYPKFRYSRVLLMEWNSRVWPITKKRMTCRGQST